LLLVAGAAVLTGMWRRAVPHELQVSPAEETVEAVLPSDAPAAGLAEAALAAGGAPADAAAIRPRPGAGGAAGAADSAREAPEPRRPPVTGPRPRYDTTLGIDDEEILRVLEVKVLGKRHPEPDFMRKRTSYVLVETRNRS